MKKEYKLNNIYNFQGKTFRVIKEKYPEIYVTDLNKEVPVEYIDAVFCETNEPFSFMVNSDIYKQSILVNN